MSRIRSYGMDAIWEWTTYRAMARDLAELVEDMEAVKQKNNDYRLAYRAILFDLVVWKLDMDRGGAILDTLQMASDKEKWQLFEDMREAIKKGWSRGYEHALDAMNTLLPDPLAFQKMYANSELESKRFVRPSGSSIR